MTTKTLFQTIATELYNAFTTDNPRKCVALKDDAPEWMREAVKAAHFDDRFPDDWIYESCRDVASSLTEYENPDEDTIDEVADRHVDTATMDLMRWLASHLNNAACCDEAAEEYGVFELYHEDRLTTRGKRQQPSAPTLSRLVTLGQLSALRQITRAVYEAIQGQVDAREAADESDGES